MTHFEFRTDVEVRFRDLDVFDHVNNAVYVTYFEQGRMDYLRDVMAVPLSDLHMVVARVEVDFRRPIEFDQEVTVGVRVAELGTKSFRMEYEVRADDEVAATGETVQVAVDPDGGETRPVPESWRESVEAHEPHL